MLLRGDLCEALEKCGRPLKAKALTNKASPGLNTWPYVRPLLRVSTHFVTTTRKRKLRPRARHLPWLLGCGSTSASAGCGKTRCLLVRGASRRQKLCEHCLMCDFLTRYSNLNRGHDTRANRVTRHTTSSSTQPHAKQQPTNAPQTNLTFTRTVAHTHLPIGERCQSTDDTAPHHSHTHSATPTRKRVRQGNHRLRRCARDPPTPPPAPPPAARCFRVLPALPCRCTCRSRPTSSSWRRVRPANCD